MNILANYTCLNRIGFDKIAKKFEKNANCVFREELNSDVDCNYFVTSECVFDLIANTVALYAKLFERGNLLKAKVRLLSKISTSPQRKSFVLRLGIKVGITLMLILWNLFNLYVTPSGHIASGMSCFTPIYRALGGCILLIWLWGLNVWVWSRYRINHVFIFEFNPQNRRHHFQIWDEAASLTIVFFFNSLLFMCPPRTRTNALTYSLARGGFGGEWGG